MFGDFFSLIKEFISYLWPFRIVEQYERGVYYFLGKVVQVPKWYGGPDCTAGHLWIVVPFFCDIKTLMVVRDTVVTPIQTIEVIGGKSLTFNASAQLEIEAIDLALNTVVKLKQTAAEDIAAILAEKLATVEPDKLEPEARGRLVGGCRQAISAAISKYGVRLLSLRFNNFVRNMRTYRLFQESSRPESSYPHDNSDN